MARTRIFFLTLLAMIAFAGNSLLCRLALKHTGIDPASFTTIRILSGALALGLIMQMRGGAYSAAGNWPSALALFIYAASMQPAFRMPTSVCRLRRAHYCSLAQCRQR